MKKRIRILNLEPSNYCKEAKEILESFSKVDERELSLKKLDKHIGTYDALIVRLGYRIDKRVIDKAKNLKVIATPATGLNHIDIKYAEENKIRIISLKGERKFLDTITATAEHTFALLLSLVRKTPFAFNSVISGNWNRDSFKGIELQNKILGILGYGRIGTMVAEYAKAFNMQVLVYDPYIQTMDKEVTLCSLEKLLSVSNIITIHVPLSNETFKFIGRKEIVQMRKGVCLINTSRGEVLDEDAMVYYLESKHLGGAALDVLADELSFNKRRLLSNKLVQYALRNNNLILTPHIGGATSESMKKTELFIAKKLKAFFRS